MANKTQITDLIARLKAASEGSLALDQDIAQAMAMAPADYTTSFAYTTRKL